MNIASHIKYREEYIWVNHSEHDVQKMSTVSMNVFDIQINAQIFLVPFVDIMTP